MTLKEAYNNLLERMKFPHYAEEEHELALTDEQSSQTSTSKEEEFSYYTFNPFGSYTNSDFNQQIQFINNRNELLRRWRETSFLPEVDDAINEICNEAIVYDETEDSIKLNLSDIDLPETIKNKINESFKKILYLLDFSERGDELFRQWYIDGVLNIESVYNNERMREGIKKLILLTPFNFNSFVDEEGIKKYYYSNNVNYNKQSKDDIYFLEEQITVINSGIWNIDKSFPVSYLNPTLKTINQLSNIEDTLVIHRLTKSIEKRMFKIPIKNIPKAKAEEYIRSLMMKYRQKKVYNTDSGTLENKNRSISILEDFWVPVDKDGSSMQIENIPAVQQTFGTFEDVDYFINKLYKALHVPINRRSAESRLTQGNQIDIEKDELKFFKFILKLRRKFNNLFLDLLKKDLIACKVLTLEDWKKIQDIIKFEYANSNQYTEIKNNQIVSMRIDTANSAMGLIDSNLISKSYIQKNILKLSDEDILELQQKEKAKEEEDSSLAFDSEFTPSEDFKQSETMNKPEETENPENPEEEIEVS